MNAPDGALVDHIYHNKIDNRKSELRLCSYSENAMNRSVSNSSSGICGVYWYSREQKWSAEIQVNNEKIKLGLYDDIEKAKEIRKEAEEKYFKEFVYKER